MYDREASTTDTFLSNTSKKTLDAEKKNGNHSDLMIILHKDFQKGESASGRPPPQISVNQKASRSAADGTKKKKKKKTSIDTTDQKTITSKTIKTDNHSRSKRTTKSRRAIILSESTPRPKRMSQIFQPSRDPAGYYASEYDVIDNDLSFTDIVIQMSDKKDSSYSEKERNFTEDFDKSHCTTTTTGNTVLYFDYEESTSSQQEQRTNDKPNDKTNEKKHSFFDKLKRKSRNFYKELMRFKLLKMFQVLLAFYIGFLTFADIGPPGGLRDTETGWIVDQNSQERTEKGLILVNGVERAIVANTKFQLVCFGITRMSAFFMYPALVMVFISKFRATTSFFSKTPLAMYMYKDSHELHVYCGWTILIDSIIHSVGHTARWAQQGNLYLLYMHFSGLSGLFIILSCLLICIPMTIFREQIRYEIRKKMHYLFIVFALALIFHAPASGIPNGGFCSWVFAIIIVWYFADAAYCYIFMTEKIDTTKFSVVPCGVRMTMAVSERFQAMGDQGGICYVCLPWIDKNQWHAFSLFENPTNPGERQIFIQKTGDWTTQVHRVLQRETVRPAWVHGPFPSPYDNAVSYDNQILVASGIGITPALSVIRAHKDSRRINLVWAVRDEALLEFFLNHLYLDHEGWNIIFYTGKKKLRDEVIQIQSDTNICIIAGRPNLGELIPNIIYGVESGLGLPENYTPSTRAAASEILADKLAASMRRSNKSRSSSSDVAEDLALQASELGFHLSAESVVEQSSEFGRDVWRGSKAKRQASKSIMEYLSIGFRPWNHHEGAQKYVKGLDRNIVLPTWGMLYCGGAKAVLKVLEEISDEYEIGLHVESFAW